MTKPTRVLVLGSSAAGGDWPPLAAVSVGLHRRGHRVLVVGDTTIASAMERDSVAVETLPAQLELLPYLLSWLERFAAGEHVPSEKLPTEEWAEGCLSRVGEVAARFQPDVVLSQLFTMELATLLKAELRIPWGFVNPAYYFGRDCLRPVSEDYAGEALVLLDSWTTRLAEADLVLHATDSRFDPPPETMPSHHHHVGPLIWEPARPTPGYLDVSGDPWALVTLSSAPQPDEISLARAALAALSGQPVRVLLTVSEGHDRDQLGTVPQNARVDSYVPHSEVLKRSCLCLSHAGHGIVAKSMFCGVPMVLVPWERDQPGVAVRAAALGVAEVVPRAQLTAKGLADAVDRVLGDSSYRENAQRTSHLLQATDPVSLACDHIEALVS